MSKLDLFDPRYQLEAEDDGRRSSRPLSRGEIRHTILMLDRLALSLDARGTQGSGEERQARAPAGGSRFPS